MAGYQYTIIIGNVGRDPELKYTQSGVAVCDFSVAVSRRWSDRNTNEQREETTWFKVTAWRGLAETTSQFVHKGMQIMVTGRITASAYIAQNGEARASLELTAQDIQFLGQRGEYAGEPGDYAPGGGDPEDLPF
ncbi:MAG: single-stranded DNA-binding protein [Chloroflexi bacterium]|jgi:single-strand DNA-binding protein|nr:single-stranded DNA-binding protein [Chloroflexota bacterium]